MSPCPRRAEVLGATALAGDAPGETGRHVDRCPDCRRFAAAARSSAHAHADADAIDCDAAEVLLAELDDGLDLDAGRAGALLTHLSGCRVCRAGVIDMQLAVAPTFEDEGDREDDGRAPGPGLADLATLPRGAYLIERELARGGMGKVSRARDRRLGRLVALKEPLPRDDGTGPSLHHAWARLEREARLAGRLGHPGIVSVYEAGRFSTGAPFCAMQLVDGRPLDEVIASAGSAQDRLALLPHAVAVADALAYAHGQRVIHRDLKPANVLVGAFGETVVIDWGLAKDLDEPEGQGERSAGPFRVAPDRLTEHGQALGTPSYMPVEQARGEALDERADVYAIGALLYHMLAGRPPYRGSDGKGVLGQVLAGPPPPLRDVAPHLPAALLAIVARAMARAPADRYPSAGALADDLRRFTTGQLVSAHSYSLTGLVRHWLRTRRISVTMTLALVAALGTGLVALALRVVGERNRARAALAVVAHQNDDLRIARAGAVLEADPSEAVAWLGQVTVDEENFRAVGSLLADARARGIAEAVLEGHGGTPEQVAVAPDGQTVATSDDRGELRLWRPASGEVVGGEVVVLAHHHARIYELCFDVAGARVAAVGEGGITVHAVPPKLAARAQAVPPGSVPLGERRLAAPGTVGPVWTCGFTANGAELVTASGDGTVRAWSLASGAERRIFTSPGVAPAGGHMILAVLMPALDLVVVIDDAGPTVGIDRASGQERWRTAATDGMAVVTGRSPDGHTLALWSVAGGVLLLDARTGAVRALASVPAVRALVFSPDGQRLFIGAGAGASRLVELATGAAILVGGDELGVRSASFFSDGRIALAGRSAQVQVLSPSGDQAWALAGHRVTIALIAVTADGRVLSLAPGEDARIWRPAPRPRRRLSGHDGPIRRVWVSATGDEIVSAGQDKTVRRFRTATGVGEIIGASDDVAVALAVSEGGAWVAIADLSGRCTLARRGGGAPVPLRGKSPCQRGLTFAPRHADPRREPTALAIDGEGRALRLELTADGGATPIPLPGPAALAGRLDADGRAWLVGEDGAVRSVLTDGTMTAVGRLPLGPTPRLAWAERAVALASLTGSGLWWLDQHGVHGPVPVNGGDLVALSLSADGARAALAHQRGAVEVIELGLGTARTLAPLDRAARHLRFSPDGTRLVAATDGELVMWSVATAALRRLATPGRATSDLAFSADGRQLASVGLSDTVLLWADELAEPHLETPAATRAAVAAAKLQGRPLATTSQTSARSFSR
jgi:serine/threonine protein kinase/WD40 repeat protein